jgi:hypothetical protein
MPHKPTLKPKLGSSVCLSYRTTIPTDKQADEKEHRSDNITYTQAGVSCSTDNFVVNGNLVVQIKFCGKSPALRVAAKRLFLGWMIKYVLA